MDTYCIQTRLTSSMNASKLRATIDDTTRGCNLDKAYREISRQLPALEDDNE